MKTFLALVGAVLATLVASASAKAASIQEEHPIDWYDCSRKADGNYLHPYDCTRFISCSGGIASQRDCANCDIPSRCKDGRTVYNVTVDRCLWTDETQCQTDGSGSTAGTTRLPSSSPAPTDPPTVAPTEDNGEPTVEPSSEQPAISSTEEPDSELPKEGDDCDPKLCRNSGECQWYFRCDVNTSKIVREECDKDLVWNPLYPNGTEHIHGGNCDRWDNLDPAIEAKYREDEECLACFWRELGQCNQEYEYQAPDQLNRDVQKLSCADGLVFSKKHETCRDCKVAKYSNGTTCC